MKKYYFFTASGENNRFIQFITKEENPIKAYNSFKDYIKSEGIKNFNITKFEVIK